MSLNVGIVGFGRMAEWHARCAQRVPGFRLVSAFDVTAARRRKAQREFGCRTFDRLDAFLDDGAADVVVVATPSHAHVEPAIAALRAGKHVLVEKPIAQTEAQAARMFAAARRAGRLLLTFQNRRFDADFLAARAAVESGRLGRIWDLRVLRWHCSRLMFTFAVKEYRPQWRSEAAYGGGTLLDFGPHLVDQALVLMPQPVESVFCDLRARRWTRDADDQFLAVLRFAGGAVAMLEMSQAAAAEVDLGWTISGQRAGFRHEKTGPVLYWPNRRGNVSMRPLRAPAEDWDAIYRNLRDAAAGKAEPLIRPAETLRLMRVLDALRKSAASGRVVSIRDVYARTTDGGAAARNRRRGERGPGAAPAAPRNA